MPGPFSGVNLQQPTIPVIKRRYSVTSDVVAYRRCARQYGAFNVHDYAPAHQTQLYFGTIIHQVLDRCHAHYNGLINAATRGTIPDNGRIISDTAIVTYFNDLRNAQQAQQPAPMPPSEILRYFIEVENGLKSRGIRAVTQDLREKAVRILQYFNALEGPQLYPRVLDTEYRLQADRGNHILHGVVDLLVGPQTNSTNPGDCEIWDYKGTSRITLTPTDLATYQFQMRVYARLYERKNGVYPKRANLYFMNELDGPTCPTQRPINAILQVDLDPNDVNTAMQEFTQTVQDIEQSRQRDQWPAAAVGTVSDQDCAICDLRWDCPTPNSGRGVALRYP